MQWVTEWNISPISTPSLSLPALKHVHSFLIRKIWLKYFPSSLSVCPNPLFISPYSWCIQVPVLILVAGKKTFPSSWDMQKLKYWGGNCRHLNGGCIFAAKTPVPLVMKELMLTVVWEIIPLEKEHLSGMTYALCIWSIQHHVCSLLWGGLLRCDLLLSWGDVVHIKDVMQLSGGRRSRVSGTGWVVLVRTPHQQAAHLKPSEFSLCNFCWFLGPGETWEASAIDGMVTTKFITFPRVAVVL